MPVINNKLLDNKKMCQDAYQATWEIVDCLRGSGQAGDVRMVLAAFLLYKISSHNNPLDFDYQLLLSTDFGLDPDISLAISEYLSEADWEKLSLLSVKYAPEVFALAAFSCELNYGFRINATEVTPDSIIRLSQKLLDIQPSDQVADLCCGYGTFLSDSALVEPRAEYCGYEINTGSKLVAAIRTSLVDDEIEVVLKDAFTLLDEEPKRRFDKIFSNYPFKMPLRNLASGAKFVEQISEKLPGLSKATSSDWVFNALLCELLRDNGKAVGIMTNGSTWNGIDTPMRKYFVEKGLVESVIALPGRMFSSTTIPTSLIVLSRGNSHVRIVDASMLCHQGRRYNEFSDEDIDAIIAALYNDSEFSRDIDLDELRKNEYTLSLNRYLKEGISFSNAVPFEDVIKSISRGAPCTARQLDEMVSDEVTNMQYLMLANIQNGIIDDKLPYLSYIDPKYERYCLKNNDLILSKNGYPYKVAIANVREGQKILANGNLYIIELDHEKVDPYYLKAFFESEQGIAVLKSITVGATIPNIGVDKLKKVEIPIPSLEEQKRIAERYQTTLDEIAIYKIKLEKAMNRLHHIIDEECEGNLVRD